MAAARVAEKVKEFFQRQIDEVQHDSPLSGSSFEFYFFKVCMQLLYSCSLSFYPTFPIQNFPPPTPLYHFFLLFFISSFYLSLPKRRESKSYIGMFKKKLFNSPSQIEKERAQVADGSHPQVGLFTTFMKTYTLSISDKATLSDRRVLHLFSCWSKFFPSYAIMMI